MQRIAIKLSIHLTTYIKYIFLTTFYKTLLLIIFFFTLANLFLLINYFGRFFYFNLSYPWFQIIFVPLVLVVIPIYFYWINKKEYNSNALLQEYKIFEFTENDVRISNATTTVLIDWQNFYKVEESKEFLILLYDYATAYFVLKADFEKPEQLTEVYAVIKSKPGLVQALLK